MGGIMSMLSQFFHTFNLDPLDLFRLCATVEIAMKLLRESL